MLNIPDNKRVEIALTYIYGIGRVKASEICNEASIEISKRVNQLTERDIAKLRDIIDKGFCCRR